VLCYQPPRSAGVCTQYESQPYLEMVQLNSGLAVIDSVNDKSGISPQRGGADPHRNLGFSSKSKAMRNTAHNRR
jgi:hypothetical protein